MTKIINLSNLGLKSYKCESQCVHFVQAGLIPNVKNEGEARKLYGEFLVKHHCNYPGTPAKNKALITKQCNRTCGVKVTVTEVTLD